MCGVAQPVQHYIEQVLVNAGLVDMEKNTSELT
jgi:hypothetical protein